MGKLGRARAAASNHVPATFMTAIPGVAPEHAERIVAARGQVGGFVSAEEVSVLADLPPALTPRLAEYGVFLP